MPVSGENVDASDEQFIVRSFVNSFTGNLEEAARDFSNTYSQQSQAFTRMNERMDLLERQIVAVRAKLDESVRASSS